MLLVVSSGCLGLPRFHDVERGTGEEAGSAGATGTATDEPPATGDPNPEAPSTTESPATTTPVETGPQVDPCEQYADFNTECYGERTGEGAFEFCVGYTTQIEQLQPQCLPLFEESLVCLSQLDCRELMQGDHGCEPLMDDFFDCV